MRQVSFRAHVQSIRDPLKRHGRLLAQALRDDDFFRSTLWVGLEIGPTPRDSSQFLRDDSVGKDFGGFVQLMAVVVGAGFRGHLGQQFVPEVIAAETPSMPDVVEFIGVFTRAQALKPGFKFPPTGSRILGNAAFAE
jgi:hypothetical protein